MSSYCRVWRSPIDDASCHHLELVKTEITIEELAKPLAGDSEGGDGQAFSTGKHGNGAWG